MDSIDVHDLPEEQAQVIAAFVEFLRARRGHGQAETEAQDQEWSALALPSFATDWNNEDDAVYDQWKEHYRLPEERFLRHDSHPE